MTLINFKRIVLASVKTTLESRGMQERIGEAVCLAAVQLKENNGSD